MARSGGDCTVVQLEYIYKTYEKSILKLGLQNDLTDSSEFIEEESWQKKNNKLNHLTTARVEKETVKRQ